MSHTVHKLGRSLGTRPASTNTCVPATISCIGMILYRFNLLGYLYNILVTSDKYVELKLRKLGMYTEHEFVHKVQATSKHDLIPQTSLIKPQAFAYLQYGTYKHLAVQTLGCFSYTQWSWLKSGYFGMETIGLR